MNTQKIVTNAFELSNEEIVNTLETCCLCGTKLRFRHQTDYLNLQVMEEASCPSCGVKNQPSHFTLQ